MKEDVAKRPYGAIKKVAISAFCVFLFLFLFGADHDKHSDSDNRDGLKGKDLSMVFTEVCTPHSVSGVTFAIGGEKYSCDDVENMFLASDLDDYVLDDYGPGVIGASNYNFKLSNTATDPRPLRIHNAKSYIGRKVVDLCPLYGLVKFEVYVEDGRYSTNDVGCYYVERSRIYSEATITGVYYKDEEKYEVLHDENNESGTRDLYITAEVIR